jgi:hypothetical protein
VYICWEEALRNRLVRELYEKPAPAESEDFPRKPAPIVSVEALYSDET